MEKVLVRMPDNMAKIVRALASREKISMAEAARRYIKVGIVSSAPITKELPDSDGL